MAIKWSQVSQKPEFLALSPEEQEEARVEYFDDVVAPRVSPEERDAVWAEFNEDTRLMPQEEAPTPTVAPIIPEEIRERYSPSLMAIEGQGQVYQDTEASKALAEFSTGAAEALGPGARAIAPATKAAAAAAGQKIVGEKVEEDPLEGLSYAQRIFLSIPGVRAIIGPLVGAAAPEDLSFTERAAISAKVSGALTPDVAEEAFRGIEALGGVSREEAYQSLADTREEAQHRVYELMPERLKGRTFEENMADPTTAGSQATWSALSNLGPTGVAIGAGLVGGATGGPAAGLAAAGSVAYALESGQAYTELKDLGVSESEARVIGSAVGAINAALEIAPLGYAAKNIPGIRKLLKAKVTALVKAKPTLAVQMIAAEGGTEAIQQVTGNAAKRVYDENQTLLEGVTESAFVGAVLGGVIGGAGAVIPTPKPVRTAADVQSESDQAKFDLAEDLHENVLPDPKRILQQSQTATIKEREASIKTEGTAQVDALEAELEDPAPTPIQTEVEVEEIEAAPAPPVSYEEMRAMTVDEAMGTLTEGHDAGTLRMTPDEFNALVDDIKENGIREPITMETGVRPGQLTLTDGRHRLLAAKAAGLRAVPVQVDPQVESVPEITLEPEAVESPVTTQPVEAVPTHSEQEIARGKPERGRLAAKYKELGGRKDKDTGGYVFRSVDKKRVERAENIFGESDVEAQPDVVGSFQTYVRDRGLDKTKLSRDEMKAIRSDYRTSLASQRPQVQTTPSDLTTKDSPMDNLRYLFQDKFIDLKRIEEVAGPGRAKPYRAETLHSGRAVSRVDDVETNIVDPLTSILAEHKIELQDLNDYMHALHAQEANAELQRRNPDRKDNDALSGMSNANAATVVSKLGGQKGMQDAAQYVRDMNDATADIIEAEGLEPGDVVQGWRDTYSNYVPLHRAGKQSLAGKGKGFSIRGRETRGRVGSESQVVDIIGHSVQNHARAIQRAEKNRVGLEVLNFARENPDSNFWTVDPVESVARFNPDTGLVETVADPTYQTKPNVFEVKEDGKTHHITFNPDNPKAVRLAESLNGLDADQMNSGLQALRTINQYLSAVNTTYNPEFMLGNFFRDVQTAGIKMEATEIQGMQVEVAKAIPEAMKTVYRSERGKTPKTEMQKYHEEWRQAGGKTGWVDAHATVESRVKELQGIINQKRGENKVRDVYKWTTGWMKDANSAVENAVRLSAYIAARKRGVSVEDAAVLSKELTVNFNRKGAWGPAFNAAWLFYNASVQGSANVLGAVASSKRVQKLVTGIAVGAFANALLQREIGGEDEDGVPYWDKIGAWEKERNLIIMNPFDDEGDYFKIPLPYGFNVFKVFGEVTADAIVRPDFNGIEAAGHVASAVVGAFNPVGSDASFLQFIAPTVLDPLVQISENKQFYGAPVMPENRFGPDKANAELYFRSARETSVKAAKALNELTGGHKYKSGYVDVSPEWIDLTVDFVTGGAGRTVADTSGTIVDVLTGEIEDRPLRRTPALRKFYSASPETWTPTTYFDYKQDITAFEAAYKDAVKSKQDRSSFRQDPRRSLIDRLKGAESLLREGYKARGEIEAKKPEGWEEKVERIEERIEKIRKRFIMMYREEMFPNDD